MQTQTTKNITTIRTEKFKTTLIKVAFKAKLDRKTITSRVLLASVLRNSSQKFASKTQLNAALENLYGASLSSSAKKQGTTHVTSFYLQIVNEKFLKDTSSLFAAALDVLGEVVLNPRLKGGAFDENVLALEARLLKEDIEAVYDDKTTYALKKMVGEMCATEQFGVSGDGYIEDLPEITGATLHETYAKMRVEDDMQITVLGDVAHAEVVPLIQSYFSEEVAWREPLSAVDAEEKSIRDVVVFEEQQLVNQTKLNIGYRTKTRMTDEDYFGMLVFNGVFGAYAHSKLFVNVREKESLCYYCAAQLDHFKGLMYVYSGLDVAQVKKATAIIDRQLHDVVTGDFTDEELTLAKKSIVNAKRESLDSASGMLSDLEVGLLLGVQAEAFIEKIEQVTKADVQRVAAKIEKDTVFVLKPHEAQQAEESS